MKNIKTIYIFGVFVALALVQLFVPAQMIWGREKVLSQGTAYKFKTRPVDPNDPFRGKYITLNYELNSAETKDTLWIRNEDVYVKLSKDSLGFASVSKVSRSKFEVSDDFVKAKVRWYNSNEQKVNFDLEFDRYYMEESKAYDAELVYTESLRDSLPENDTYAIVFVKGGEAVLADVIINEMSIKDYVEKENNK